MKRAYLFFLSVITLSVTSCKDFLTQDPKTSMSVDQIFGDLNTIQPFINDIYYNFRAVHSDRKSFYTRIGLDEVRLGDYQTWTEANEAALNYYNGLYNTENTCFASLWSCRWPVVVEASQAIDALEKMTSTSEEDAAKIALFMGQAKFFRGAMLFELAQYWGALPLTTVKDGKIELSGRKTIEETYTQIESDLLAAVNYLPLERQSDQRIPTTWAAKAILARMYMSAPEASGKQSWQKASNELQDIIDSKQYSLVSSYADLWDPEKSADQEAVFIFLFNNIWPDTNILQWYTGSRAASGDPNCYFGGYDLACPTKWCYSKKMAGGVWEDGDTRYDASIRTDFTYKGNKPVAVTGFGNDQLLPHFKKYEDIRIDGVKSFWQAGKNTYYIRYADVLLLQAECKSELGDGNAAAMLVNEVRRRGFGGTIPAGLEWTAMSKETFRDQLMDERTREFCCEEWRRIDLVRSGLFIQRVLKYNDWAAQNGILDQHHLLFPLPQTETKTNTNLTPADQNPGY